MPFLRLLAILVSLLAGLAPARAQDLGGDVWAFLPLSGDLADHGPGKRAATVQGGVTVEPMRGPFAGAADFAGGWIALPETGEQDWGSFTLAAWVWFDDSRGPFTPLLGRLGLSGDGYGLSYATGGLGERPILATPQVPAWKRWSHVVLVHDAERRSLDVWMGGWLSASIALPEGQVLPSPFSGGFGIGGAPGRVFTGRLAEVLVVRRALSSDEIRDLSQGMGRQRPLQVAASQGCGGRGEPPCQVCASYQSWPPSRWHECGPALIPWCAADPRLSDQSACP